jgi:fatty-acyl-CoA synthase
VAQFNALGISHLFATDEMVDRMLALAPGGIAFPSVRWGGYAGFNTSLADIVARADQRGLKLVGLYGMSEIQAFFSTRRMGDAVTARAAAGGYPVSPMAVVRVRDPLSGKLLDHGREGELEIAGPSRMVGYFANAEATRAGLTEDGFVRTGDLGRTAADGSFTFLTRMGDVLRLAGFLVSPAEIEAYLQLHPGVAASQVVALARPDGVRAVAFVVPRPGIAFDEAAVIEHCRKGLANYKVPVRVLPIDDFPRTPSANGFKIQRNKLRDIAEQRIGAAPT